MNELIDETLPLAAVYRRVSTDQQDGSLETQEKRVDDYTCLWRFQTTENTLFADDDVSGSVPILQRPGGAKLFAALTGGARAPRDLFNTSWWPSWIV